MAALLLLLLLLLLRLFLSPVQPAPVSSDLLCLLLQCLLPCCCHRWSPPAVRVKDINRSVRNVTERCVSDT